MARGTDCDREQVRFFSTDLNSLSSIQSSPKRKRKNKKESPKQNSIIPDSLGIWFQNVTMLLFTVAFPRCLDLQLGHMDRSIYSVYEAKVIAFFMWPEQQ